MTHHEDDMTAYIYEYKCRRCGKVFDGRKLGHDQELYDQTRWHNRDPIAMSSLLVHDECSDGALGLADMIGARKE